MPRPQKKSLSQKAVSVGTIGMPKPVRKFLTGRIVAALIVLLIPVSLATGVVSVTWKSGLPKLSINYQKAGEIKEHASQQIQELRDKAATNSPGAVDTLTTFKSRTGSQFGSASDRNSDETVTQKSAGLIRELTGRLK